MRLPLAIVFGAESSPVVGAKRRTGVGRIVGQRGKWIFSALFILTMIMQPGRVGAQGTRSEATSGNGARSVSASLAAASSAGLAITGVQPDSTSQLPLATGATWIRLVLSWSVVEPSPGVFNWTAYDSEFQAAQTAGYQVIATFRDNPAWTDTSSDPTDHRYQCRLDPSQFGAFQAALRAIVGRYSAAPYHVTMWEIGNEPDNDDAINRYGMMSCYGAEPDVYANLLKVAYPVIKEINSANQVVVGGLALDWFDCDQVTPNLPGHVNPSFLGTILTDGAPFDLMNIHYYPNFRVRWEGYGADVAGKLAWVRGVMNRHGATQPIIVTEAGAVSNLHGDSNAWQSRYVVQLYSRAAAQGTPITVWFNLVDTTGDTDINDDLKNGGSSDEYLDTDNDGDTSAIDSNHGLYFDYGTSTPAKIADIAFQRFALETNGATYVRQLGLNDTGYAPGQIEGYEFRGMASKKKVWVLWTFLDVCASEPNFMTWWGSKTDKDRRDCSGNAPTLQYTVTFNQTPLRVLDKLGNQIAVSGSPAQVTVGIDPVYVEFDDSALSGLPPATPAAPTLTSDSPNLVCYPYKAYVPFAANVTSSGW